MRFYMGKRVGKRGSFGVSVDAGKVFKVIGYIIFSPFILTYYVCIWPFVAIVKASKKKKQVARKAPTQTVDPVIPYSMRRVEEEEEPEATPVEFLPLHPAMITGSSRKFYQEAQATPYVVIDVETTGLSNAKDQIIELSMIRCEDGQMETYSSLFCPDVPVSDRIVKLTGITREELAGAPKLEDHIDEIFDFIGDRPLVAHNARFDAGFLCRAGSEAGREGLLMFYDTLALARKAFPYLRDHKLNTLIQALELTDGQQTHRALDDAAATQKLFEICIDRLLEQKEKELAQRRAKKAAQKAAASAVCPSCGAPVSGNFCSRCGAKI